MEADSWIDYRGGIIGVIEIEFGKGKILEKNVDYPELRNFTVQVTKVLSWNLPRIRPETLITIQNQTYIPPTEQAPNVTVIVGKSEDRIAPSEATIEVNRTNKGNKLQVRPKN